MQELSREKELSSACSSACWRKESSQNLSKAQLENLSPGCCPCDLRASPSPCWWSLSHTSPCTGTHTQPQCWQTQPSAPMVSERRRECPTSRERIAPCQSPHRSCVRLKPGTHRDRQRPESPTKLGQQTGQPREWRQRSAWRNRPGTGSSASSSTTHLPGREHPF